ncbi:hypothetical protein RJ639_002564 [Escallonia herrerae]|uniref:Telomere length regulation protein conserved domain-containing protein n=1 Tax=Escallonia herrerae TaxID=1293975 RepID=A0AA89BTJ8_9ASTE|nr:hypothetical protein RJ639_002564 [Escallonia herrerae]
MYLILQVERALDVAEDLVRASPDELRLVAGDMARTLVQVRCSESTVEGEEEAAEEKRQKALVALIVIHVSQRIMILDVMTDAAQELANAKVKKPKHSSRAYISIVSDVQPCRFGPSSTGPSGAGSWREIPGTGMPLDRSYSYERELPARPSYGSIDILILRIPRVGFSAAFRALTEDCNAVDKGVPIDHNSLILSSHGAIEVEALPLAFDFNEERCRCGACSPGDVDNAGFLSASQRFVAP